MSLLSRHPFQPSSLSVVDSSTGNGSFSPSIETDPFFNYDLDRSQFDPTYSLDCGFGTSRKYHDLPATTFDSPFEVEASSFLSDCSASFTASDSENSSGASPSDHEDYHSTFGSHPSSPESDTFDIGHGNITPYIKLEGEQRQHPQQQQQGFNGSYGLLPQDLGLPVAAASVDSTCFGQQHQQQRFQGRTNQQQLSMMSMQSMSATPSMHMLYSASASSAPYFQQQRQPQQQPFQANMLPSAVSPLVDSGSHQFYPPLRQHQPSTTNYYLMQQQQQEQAMALAYQEMQARQQQQLQQQQQQLQQQQQQFLSRSGQQTGAISGNTQGNYFFIQNAGSAANDVQQQVPASDSRRHSMVSQQVPFGMSSPFIVAPVARAPRSLGSPTLAAGLSVAASSMSTSPRSESPSPSIKCEPSPGRESLSTLATAAATRASSLTRKTTSSVTKSTKSSIATKRTGIRTSPQASKSSSGSLKNTTRRFVCTYEGCGRAFARNFNMQSHLKSHLGIRDFNCPCCPKKFSRRHDRARHCSAVHDVHNVETLYPELDQGRRASVDQNEEAEDEAEEEGKESPRD